MTRRPLQRRLATATATALGLALVLDRLRQSSQTAAPAGTPAARAAVSAAAGTGRRRAAGVDLSGVTLRIGETGWKQQQLLLENAGRGRHPVPTEFSLFQGGNLQLEALGAGAIDLASASEIPPIFAAQSGGPGSLNIIAVREGSTLTQEVVVPEGSTITDVAGLKGKKVAYVQNTTAHYFLLKALKEAGLPGPTSRRCRCRPATDWPRCWPTRSTRWRRTATRSSPRTPTGATTAGRCQGHPVRQLRLRLACRPSLADPAKKAAIADYFSRLQQGFNWARANPDAWAAVIADGDQAAGGTGAEDVRRRGGAAAQQVRPDLAGGDRLPAGRLDTFVEAGILSRLRHRRLLDRRPSTRI